MTSPFLSRRAITAFSAITVLLLSSGAIIPAFAKPTPAALFGDNAVLQRDVPLRIWGRADPGESVTVRFYKATVSGIADANGHWQLTLPATPRPLGPGSEATAGGDLIFEGATENTISRNVVYGDVWLCSGQSNMEWQVRKVTNAIDEIAAANYPGIRQFKVPERFASTLLSPYELEGEWIVCSPPTVGKDFTAVGYFFALDLHRRYNIPQGLIKSAWGGTPVEAWMSIGALALADTAPAVAPLVPDNRRAPAGAYNAMIHPLIPVALRGVLWYQGEANARNPDGYGALFRTLITDWRQRWQSPELPFLFVQLPNHGSSEKTNWAKIREGQASVLALPATSMAVTIDLGDPKDIHPRNKQDVAHRLALLARRMIFDEDVMAEGPRFASAKFEGETMCLRFSGTAGSGGQLMLRDPLPGKVAFELAGEDGVFHPADPTIEGIEIRLHSNLVRAPKAVRYAFRNNPDPILFNEAGLPAAPFVFIPDQK
ncbi:sialate O-acetylesterase [Geminisphaera colitermitum]|uniref:sialate O-acetylesterase n=1 Tax=Geminisphaera colitermitum TaxID=1148786 RepID=UPI000158D4A6|nr:sialate O-acetylesterase [Geminisphaera colitermitum]